MVGQEMQSAIDDRSTLISTRRILTAMITSSWMALRPLLRGSSSEFALLSVAVIWKIYVSWSAQDCSINQVREEIALYLVISRDPSSPMSYFSINQWHRAPLRDRRWPENRKQTSRPYQGPRFLRLYSSSSVSTSSVHVLVLEEIVSSANVRFLKISALDNNVSVFRGIGYQVSFISRVERSERNRLLGCRWRSGAMCLGFDRESQAPVSHLS